ncbi:MAG: AIR carboxylase family protein [Candidatus Kariarchaeaceae archaeon]|jgi:5-(carboxyamino)imidazole ribonucleotide mutase
MSDIVIISGSASDDHIVSKIVDVLERENRAYETFIASAHRNPVILDELLEQTKKTKVYICVAGLSAALPGVVSSKVKQPVIGVPVSSALGGLDALLSIAQMPKGVPVATVGIDNGANAAHLAIRILQQMEGYK